MDPARDDAGNAPLRTPDARAGGVRRDLSPPQGGSLVESIFPSFLMRHWALLLSLTALPAAAAERPNVVLVTLDTTRADRMGFLGSTRGLTPALDALARQGTVFERAFAQAPITTVSHATILSGTYPQFHRVNDFGVPLPASVPWLPDLLRLQGYHTAAFVGALILDPRGGLAPGFDRGFDTYDAGFKIKRGKEDRYATKI